MAYAFTHYDPATMARAQVRDASVSFKKSQMIAKKLRGMMSDKALAYLEAVQAEKAAVPFTKYTNGAGHKRGIGPGKYPVTAAFAFAELLKSCVANAENKGLGTPLRIAHVLCQEGSRPMRAGRQRGHQAKRTHIELVLIETEESKKVKKPVKKSPAKEAPKKAAPKPAPAEKPAEKMESEAPKKAAPEETPKGTAEQPAKEKPAEKQPAKSESKPQEEESSNEKAKDVKKDGN